MLLAMLRPDQQDGRHHQRVSKSKHLHPRARVLRPLLEAPLDLQVKVLDRKDGLGNCIRFLIK